jgi:hypothetical protein
MMDRKSVDGELKSALTVLETSLSTPIVSGELAAWVDEVRKTWQQASARIHEAVTRLHPRQYDEIAEQDLELLPQVERLKLEDEAIERDRQRIGQMIERDAQHVPKLEPDEGKAQKHVQNLIDDGLAFITRVRKQEVAVETWLVEAFNRDRGTAD